MCRFLCHNACCLAVFSGCVSPALLVLSLASPSPLSFISFNRPDATSISPCEDKPHIWRGNCALQIYSEKEFKPEKQSFAEGVFQHSVCLCQNASADSLDLISLLNKSLHWNLFLVFSGKQWNKLGNGSQRNGKCPVFYSPALPALRRMWVDLERKDIRSVLFLSFPKSAAKWNKKMCTGTLIGLCYPSSLKPSICLVFHWER